MNLRPLIDGLPETVRNAIDRLCEDGQAPGRQLAGKAKLDSKICNQLRQGAGLGEEDLPDSDINDAWKFYKGSVLSGAAEHMSMLDMVRDIAEVLGMSNSPQQGDAVRSIVRAFKENFNRWCRE